jgi:hypothetical protein
MGLGQRERHSLTVGRLTPTSRPISVLECPCAASSRIRARCAKPAEPDDARVHSRSTFSSPARNNNGSTRDINHFLKHRRESHIQHATLANAVAVSRCARGLVLLGDPQQLAQPTQAQHPEGSGISALEHMIDGAATISADQGIFLSQTWRMHPDLTLVVSNLMYEGRLKSAPATVRHLLRAPEPWAGAGVRWVPVHHTGNEAASSEEALVVQRCLHELLGSDWVDSEGFAHTIGLKDVLIVAPYNAQVGRLCGALPTGARVGTVDKFQGQEAPIVIYSMASSSADDAPRGVSFLYDLHRLNVALRGSR